MKSTLTLILLTLITPVFSQDTQEEAKKNKPKHSLMADPQAEAKKAAEKKAKEEMEKMVAEEKVKDLATAKQTMEDAKKAAAEAAISTAAAREAAGPEKVTLHTIAPGGSLTAVSAEAYGLTRYWRILKLYNKVDPSKLQVGQEIKAPDISWLIANSGLEHVYPKAVANIMGVKKTLTEIQDRTSILTAEDLTRVKEAAGLIGEAQTLLMKKKPGVTGTPNATLNQLLTVKIHLNHIANKTRKGRTDPHSLAHEHLSNAIVYGVLWAQDDFK